LIRPSRPSMISKGIATFTLDTGKCPPWLFARMEKLGREMIRVIIEEYGPDEMVRRLADPVWFQSLGTVLAFDWNASGLTTTLTAALKSAIRMHERELGFFICGGKGKTSLKVPEEIDNWAQRLSLPYGSLDTLAYNSKMAAKVDSSLVQDGYQIYHHCFVFSRSGSWAVIQQGMNTGNATARRYHWHSDKASDLIVEPHTGIASQVVAPTLDLTSHQSDKNRDISLQMANGNYYSLVRDLKIIDKYSYKLVDTVRATDGQQQLVKLDLHDHDFYSHPVEAQNFLVSPYLKKILYKVCSYKPENYRNILEIAGVGPKTIRALSLVSEVIYGAKPSYTDPARYSFAHGGKDGIPFPVDLDTYDNTIKFFRRAIPRLNASAAEKAKMQKKLDSIEFKTLWQQKTGFSS